jgi:formylglycine-generating enzyme required for sulfatase activity
MLLGLLASSECLEALYNEAPVHSVRISPALYMGRTEVTVGQFRRFLEASGYVPESHADGTGDYGYNANYDAKKPHVAIPLKAATRATAGAGTRNWKSPQNRYTLVGMRLVMDAPK